MSLPTVSYLPVPETLLSEEAMDADTGYTHSLVGVIVAKHGV